MRRFNLIADVQKAQEWRSERSTAALIDDRRRMAEIQERVLFMTGGHMPRRRQAASILDTMSDCLHSQDDPPVLDLAEREANVWEFLWDSRQIELAREQPTVTGPAPQLGRDRNPEILRVEDKRFRICRVQRAFEIGAAAGGRKADFLGWSSRMSTCGDDLLFAECPEGHHRRLRAGHFCQVRACPMCAWRRSLRMKLQYTNLVQQARAEEYHILHLVLTLKNTKSPYGQLKRLWDAYGKMRRREVWKPVQGAIATVEITWSEETGYHFHLHVLVLVPPISWQDLRAGKRSMDQKALSQAWEEVTGDSFIVHVGGVKPKARHYAKAKVLGLGKDGALVAALDELCKYPAKEADFFAVGKGKEKRELQPHDLVTGEVSEEFQTRALAFCDLMDELHGKNLRSLTGWFRGRIAEEDPNADEEAAVFVSQDGQEAAEMCPCCGKPLQGVIYRHHQSLVYTVAAVGPLAEMVAGGKGSTADIICVT